MSEVGTIHVAAALIQDSEKNVLLVRKKGTDYFMQPGGKIEPTESPEDALIRELFEELGIVIDKEQLMPMGLFTDVAANELNHTLFAHMFTIRDVSLQIRPAAEIAEAIWLSADHVAAITLAPLTKNQILPLAWKEEYQV
ncbi:NUDIX domain-containing protein [Tatumella sp. TA1]|uniref:NUDIX hydrolase n=1 Tax=Rosenbergiella collisarenosi TaxID=1544695 RepID=UPI0008F89DE3|nr:NUDIX domain-containing protein [Rosenbergiella collisarenosi]MBT0720276.1 NUDIX domain-containing protein [Rosenbergiella collisarenosi]QGX91999.1 NUDIX domain-containing protein [Tatumella sp. TA1]